MTKIEYVEKSTVKLVQAEASDFMVAKAAWVSNFGEHGEIQLPSDLKTDKWRLRSATSVSDLCAEDQTPVGGLINFLYRERHMSPFEHGSLTFVVDTPIFVAREFMRHRTFSYNETSGRYKELEPRFYLIDSERPVVQKGKVGAYRFDGGTDEQYGITFANTTLAYAHAWQAYQNMLDKGVAREVARNVLPVGTMTQFYVTGNPRNWMQFFLLRNDPNALHEIREVAKAIEAEFARQMPYTYDAFKKYDWRDERAELLELRKKVAQLEAFESYAPNIAATEIVEHYDWVEKILGLAGNGKAGKVRNHRSILR